MESQRRERVLGGRKGSLKESLRNQVGDKMQGLKMEKLWRLNHVVEHIIGLGR